MRFIRFVLCISFALLGLAYASDPPAALSDEELREIVKKGVPAEISVTLTEESEDAVALKSCQKTLTGLKVPKDCCKNPECVRNAIKQRDNEAYERRRAEVNRKFCLEYGGHPDTCSDPSSARLFVIAHRAELKAKEEEQREYDRRRADQAYQDAQEAKRLAEEASRKVNADPQPRIYHVQDPSPKGPSHHLDLGLTLIGHLEGAYGGGVYAVYRPPFVGERLELGLTVGSVVIVRNRLSIDNFDPVARAYGDANLSFRLLNFEKLSLAVGCSYTRIGRFGLDRLTAEMVGPTTTLNIGALQLHAAYLYNTGPFDGYLTPEWGVLFRAGFRFADF